MIPRRLLATLLVCVGVLVGAAPVSAEIPPLEQILLRELPGFETARSFEWSPEQLIDSLENLLREEDRVGGRAWRLPSGGTAIGVVIATRRGSVPEKIMDQTRADTGRDGQSLPGAPETSIFRGVSLGAFDGDIIVTRRGGSVAIYLFAPQKGLDDAALARIARAQRKALPDETVSEGFVPWLPGSRTGQALGLVILLVGIAGLRRFVGSSGGAARHAPASRAVEPNFAQDPLLAPPPPTPTGAGVPWDSTPL